MVFRGIVIVPLYVRTGASSLPEFLQIRFGLSASVLSPSIVLIYVLLGGI